MQEEEEEEEEGDGKKTRMGREERMRTDRRYWHIIDIGRREERIVENGRRRDEMNRFPNSRVVDRLSRFVSWNDIRKHEG